MIDSKKRDQDQAPVWLQKIAALVMSPLYFTLWFLGLLVHLTPFRIRLLLARADAFFIFHVLRFRRRIICHNLCLVFPRRESEPMQAYRLRIEKLCYENYVHYMLCYFEVLERFHWTPDYLARTVEIEGREVIDSLKSQGRGYFFLTAHMGNWELVSKMGVLIGLPLAIVTKFLRNPFFDALWVKSRKNYGLYLIPERRSGLEIARVIKKKAMAVAFVLDQHTGEPHGIESVFLGKKAMCAKALAILSHRIGAPIVPSYLVRKEDGRMRLVFEKAIFPEEFEKDSGIADWRDKSGSLSAKALAYHVGRCNEIMEKWIRSYPEQYLWLHKRFKNFQDYKAPLVWEF